MSAGQTTIIAVVGFRCPDLLTRLVAACDRLTHAAVDLHICENGGDDSYATLLAALEDEAGCDLSDTTVQAPRTSACSAGTTPAGRRLVVHRAEGNLGYAGGLNVIRDAVLDRPGWDSFWVLNPDALPDPASLTALRRHLARGYGATGGRLVFSETGRVQQYGGRWRWWLGRGFNLGFNASSDDMVDSAAIEQEMTYISGACMLVSRAYLETVGAMDERYFLFSEEVDWCLRRGPFRLGYCHEAVIRHDQGATIGSYREVATRSAFSIYLLERSGLLLTRKFRPLLLPVVAVTSGLYVLRYARRGGLRAFRPALAGWLAGLMGESGFPRRYLRGGGP